MIWSMIVIVVWPGPGLSRVEASRGGPRLSETWPTAHWAPELSVRDIPPTLPQQRSIRSIHVHCFNNIRRDPSRAFSLFVVESAL